MTDTPRSDTEAPKKPPRKRNWFRVILLLLFFVFIIIQFFQLDKNNNDILAKNDIRSVVPMPDTVQQLLKTACYDCHSNNTEYPWYINIQPISWWMTHHIEDGKKHLNFDEFASITARNGRTKKERQLKVLEEIKEQTKEGEMPLTSYLVMHPDARLNKAQRDLIAAWSDSARQVLGSAVVRQ